MEQQTPEVIEVPPQRQRSRDLTALDCVRFLIILELLIKIVIVITTGTILFLEWDKTTSDQSLRIFLCVYVVLTITKGFVFYFKNKQFFMISRIPELDEDNDIALLNNILEATMLFWHIVGFHCLQDCTNCKITQPWLYYTTLLWVSFGFISFILPLLAIAMLLLLLSFLKPKLESVEYHEGCELPNDTKMCTICYEEYIGGIKIKILPCDHHFHADCIDEWISIRENCPLCKKNINILFDIVEGDETISI
ncbi:RING4 [Hepatospora eriocheir]|uniref:RING-type E3 ubiquitin transferase n=1 Tax=Hepatospora eriocheir TaxID=1081669 RepID=A0A1X0QEE2_9MICR|nr:RING4 [Hepatospora eriocheir]